MSDGSIRISTKILTDGAKKGFATLKKEALDSAGAIKKGFGDVGDGIKILGQRATNAAKGGIKNLGQQAINSTKQMLAGFNEQVEVLDRQHVTLENLKRRYDLIASGDVVPASVKSMQSELAKANKEAQNLGDTLNKMLADQQNMEQRLVPGSANYDTEIAALDKISAAIEEVGSKYKATRDRAAHLKEEISKIKMDPESSVEAQDLASKIQLVEQNIDKTEGKAVSFKDKLLGMAKIKFGTLSGSMSGLKSGFEGIGSKIDKLKSRITKLVGAAFVFNLMRRGLSQLSSSMTSLLSSNTQFSSSLNQIKANLMTAFAPIYTAILPAIQALMNALSAITGTIASFVASLFGKTVGQAKASAKSLQSQAQAYDQLGKSAKDAQGKLASFDTLEVNDASKDASSNGGAGIDFSQPVETSSPFLEILEKIKDVLSRLFEPFKIAWDSVGSGVIESIKYAFSSILELLADVGSTFLDVWDSDLGVSIATHLLSIWTNINKMIGNVAKSVKIVWDRNENGKKLLEGFLGMLDKILGVVDSISRSFADFALSESFQTGLELAMSILTRIFEIIGWISEAFSNAWDEHGLEILTGAQDILNEVMRLVDDIAASLQMWVMSEGFQMALSTILDMIGTLLGWLADIAGWIVDMYEKYMKPIVEEKIIPLCNTIISIIAAIWEAIKPVVEWVINALETVLEPAIAALCGIIGGIIDVVQWVADLILGIINGDISQAFSDFGQFAQNCWDFICGVFVGAATWFNDTLIQPVKDFFSGMWNGLKDGAHNAWEGIKNVFSVVANWFRDIFHNAWEGVKNVFSTGGKIFSGIKEGIENVFKTVVNGIIDGVNKVIAIPFNTINGFLNTIRGIDILGFRPFEGLWGHNPLSVPQIPRLATGGVAYAPMIAQIGEYAGARSNPEIVTPENLMRQIVREESSGSKEVVIEELTIITKIGEDTLQRQVIKGVRAEEKTIGRPLFVS